MSNSHMTASNPQFFGAEVESLGKETNVDIEQEGNLSSSNYVSSPSSGLLSKKSKSILTVAASLAVGVGLLVGITVTSHAETVAPEDVPHCVGECQTAAANAPVAMLETKTKYFNDGMMARAALASRGEGPANLTTGALCVNGTALDMPCENIDVVSMLSSTALGSQFDYANDQWGWTDTETNREYALTCHWEGFSIADITTPEFPVPLFFVKGSSERGSVWSDLKVYKNFVFKVSEGQDHGMQVFDLTKVRGRTPANPEPYSRGEMSVLQYVSEDALYTEFGSAHNIVINEEEGFAFSVGSKTCNGGFHMVNIRDPLRPVFAGCFSEDGYTHDAQCVTYRGPDYKYFGKEICFAFQGGTMTIVDVTKKSAPKILSQRTYPNSTYVHQGWLTEDSRFLLVDDELDEVRGRNSGYTETILFNVEDLENPELLFKYQSPTTSIDHNLYVKGRYAFQSNYNSGLRVTDTRPLYHCQEIEEVAFLDVFPENDDISFDGTWSNYPYFESGNIIISSMDRGLVIARLSDSYKWY